jgi:hypothetical protein
MMMMMMMMMMTMDQLNRSIDTSILHKEHESKSLKNLWATNFDDGEKLSTIVTFNGYLILFFEHAELTFLNT